MILSQLRRRRSRALALASGILVAATSFVLLTGTVTTSQARTTGIVEASARSAYDILVRPAGTKGAVERDRGLVEANFLSGVFGGMTLDQYRRIKSLSGVETAAPVANIGYTLVQSTVPVDVSAFRDSKAQSQLLRLKPKLTAGLAGYPSADQYVYLTRNPIVDYEEFNETTWPGLLHEKAGGKKYAVCWFYNEDKSGKTKDWNGEPLPRPMTLFNPEPETAFSPDARSRMTCVPGDGKPVAEVPVAFPVLLSAIDPAAEDELVGLSGAVTSGRMLTAKDRPVWGPDAFSLDPVESQRQHDYQTPVMLSSRALTAGTLSATVERLDVGDPAALPAKLGSAQAHDFVNGLRGTAVGKVTADLAAGFRSKIAVNEIVENYWTVGPVGYRSTEDGLVAQTRPAQPPGLWKDNVGESLEWNVPEENTGTQFRKVTPHASTSCLGRKDCEPEDRGRGPAPVLNVVGRYDAAKLRGFSALSKVPLETYQSPEVTGADDATRKALDNQPLRPDRNLGGYLSAPPTLLTTLDSISVFTHSRRKATAQEKAPISAIRIRVEGVKGVDPASRARVNSVAGQIRAAYPDLQLDVTVGSSPAPQTIVLPSDKTTIKVTERWVAKGVALRILKAVDTKSAVLFVLVLVVCGLFLSQAALASVRSRRTEIGTLRCVGWSTPEILRLILGELAVIGFGAGALGALLAYGLGSLLDLPGSAAKAALVLPVALLLALVAGLVPAWRATRVTPLDAVTPAVTATRRAVPVRSVAGLALRNLVRARGRTLLGAAGLALGVAAFTVLLSLTLAFRGEVAGSLLGNAVVAQARTADYVSVVLSLLLGAAGAVDVLVMSQRERAADLAVLRATGWSNRELARLTLYEGAGLAMLGGLTGAAVGLTTVVALGQGVLAGRLLVVAGAALLAGLAAVGLVCAVLSVPIRALSRIAPAHLLAAE
ncbi:FtsX-like permease family protein [Streptomyces cavernae]|uniref:FtsX-like permease family protein n=1 Tax=Streptomyces cavernae TaxID=2259034 RepID=UPI000FEBDE24|nr:ABC transporter permease [Streptomyces cavernae]